MGDDNKLCAEKGQRLDKGGKHPAPLSLVVVQKEIKDLTLPAKWHLCCQVAGEPNYHSSRPLVSLPHRTMSLEEQDAIWAQICTKANFEIKPWNDHVGQ